MRSLDETELIRLLEGERPEPDAEFSRELDEWAAAGFPRGGWRAEQEPATVSPARRLIDRLLSTPPRRLIAPVGAVATLAVVVGVAVVQVTGPTEDDATSPLSVATTGESTQGPDSPSLDAEGGAGAEAGGAGGVVAEEAARAELDSLDSSSAADAPPIPATPGPATGRQVHQEVDLTLSTEPEALRDVADGVIQVADSHGGLVISSDVSSIDPTDGREATGRADFELRIPAAELQATLDELSDLAHVASRSDGAVDITNKFRAVEREIESLVREREQLVIELEDASTPAERRSIRAEIDAVDAQLRAANDRHSDLTQRVKMVPVSVTLVGEGEPDDGEWGISDALDDAGQVLTTSLGVLLVGAAVVLPLALLVLISAWAWRVVAHQRRERTLDAG